MAKSLGEELSSALSNITALIIKTESKSERTRLTRQQTKIAGLLQKFVDGVVDKSLPEYEDATKALNTANAQAKAAKRNLDEVAVTIDKVASAIDKLVALAKKIGVA